MEGIRCLDPNCRKRLPDRTRYCPYCGMPILQTMLPFWQPYFYRRAGLVAALVGSCAGVYLTLGLLLTPLWESYQLAMATATLTPLPTLTVTPSPTLTPFPRLKPTETPTQTPIPLPTPVMVRLVESTPMAIMGQVNDPFRLFSQPSYSSDPVMATESGHRIRVLGKESQGLWLKAEIAGYAGWLNADLVSLDAPWTLDNLPVVK